MTDLSHRVILVNPAARQLFRKLLGADLREGIPLSQCLPYSSSDSWERVFQLVSRGRPLHWPNYQLPDSTDRFNLQIRPLWRQEQLIGFSFTAKEAPGNLDPHELLDHPGASISTILESNQDYACALSCSGTAMLLNEKAAVLFQSLFGAPLVKGSSPFEEMPARQRAFWLRMFKKALQGQTQFLERHYCTQQRRYYEVSATPMRPVGGAISGVFFSFRDITEWVLNKQSIQKSEKQLSLLIRTMHEGLVYVDNDNIIQFVNPRFCEMTGYSNSELLGQLIVKVAADDEMAERVRQKSALRLQKVRDDYELRLCRKDGSLFWVLVNASPMVDGAGNVVGAIGTFADIHKLKQTEEALRRTNHELNTFLYKASHDLKGPLSSMRGLTNLALDEVAEEPVREYLELIDRSTVRLESILQELLAAVRIKHEEPKYSPVEIRSLAAKVVDDVRTKTGTAKVQVRMLLDALPPLLLDQHLVYLALYNLLENAIKFHNPNHPEPFAHIAARQENRHLILEVSDNGTGIPLEKQQQVFEMFYRGSQQAQGAGLGLYIAQSALHKLGGQLLLRSHEGKGSVFQIIIPLKDVYAN